MIVVTAVRLDELQQRLGIEARHYHEKLGKPRPAAQPEGVLGAL